MTETGVASRGKSATSGLSEPLFGYFDRVVPKGGREVRAANAALQPSCSYIRVDALNMTVASSQDCMSAKSSVGMSRPHGQEARTKYIKDNLEPSKHLPYKLQYEKRRHSTGSALAKHPRWQRARWQDAEIL